MGARRDNSGLDATIARLAANHHGVISLAQLEHLGIRRSARSRRIRAQRLHRIHRGVYAVGHRGLSEKGRWMAAVLACGQGAALSHTSAAALWGMLRGNSSSDTGLTPASSSVLVHVTVPGNQRSRSEIRVHRSRTLFPSELARRDGIPVTTPSRTLTDLRLLLPQPQFAAALRQAEFLRLPIDELESDRTRSELEARFLQLCRRHRLPQPDVNVQVGPFIVDFLWPDRRLIVELDGYGTHGSRSAFEADRARDAELMLRGFDVIRLTWRQLSARSAGTAAMLRKLLRSGTTL